MASFNARHLVVAAACLVGPLSTLAQEAKPADAANAGRRFENTDRRLLAAAADPLAVPQDADAKELLDFIRSVERRREGTKESYLQSARAIAQAADAIRQLKGLELTDELVAIRKHIEALRTLASIGAPAERQSFTDLLESLASDDRAPVAKLVRWESLRADIRGAGLATRQQQLEWITRLKEMLSDQPFDRDAFIVASSLARGISYSKQTDLAAALYDHLAEIMSQSSDESFRRRAEKMRGAARRMRLPGNPIEITGTTLDGETFNWDAYRGKVVLNWYWASWCRRCRAEVEIHQRYLQQYGDRGFAIVGINLDKDLQVCRDYAEEQGITWTNLFSDEDGGRGWNNPMAQRYGITAIPTAILIDAEGRVLTLNARGKELQRALEQLFEDSEQTEPGTLIKK